MFREILHLVIKNAGMGKTMSHYITLTYDEVSLSEEAFLLPKKSSCF